ncbi:MAG: glycoside hydrolase family 3 protein [Cyclobacteriaceae bacterium]|nr:glycoside hydrolase family 3 protein [Cyclobacteriaceae bacterium]
MVSGIVWMMMLPTISVSAQTRDSLDIKIGQMILMGIPYAQIDTAVLEEVRKGNIGSIILFEKNIPKKSSAFADLKKIIWTYQEAAPYPIFVSIDQEGGKVNRLKEKYGFTKSITARATGKSKSLDSARFYGEATASTLSGLGFNVNFAPCVDVAVEPTNPVIVKSERSYSPNEDTVTMMAGEFIRQHRKYGVVTVLKHFPGHGSSTTDSHYGIADVTKSWTPREIKPYQSLLDSGLVDGVMSCHIVNKELDKSGRPGTLSVDMLDGMLRKKLGYQGVVFSDDMQMEAITKQYGLDESIKMAILAGVDILCFANNVPGSQKVSPQRIFSVIKNAVASGEISAERINQSYHRIIALKKKIDLTNRGELESNFKKLELRQKLTALQLKAAREEIKLLQEKVDSSGKKKKKKKSKEK